MKKVYLLVVSMCILLTSMTAFAAPDRDSVKMGMRGENVKVLQKLLSEKGFYVGEIDGVFGEMTLRATKSFQNDNGLVADGVAGRESY